MTEVVTRGAPFNAATARGGSEKKSSRQAAATLKGRFLKITLFVKLVLSWVGRFGFAISCSCCWPFSVGHLLHASFCLLCLLRCLCPCLALCLRLSVYLCFSLFLSVPLWVSVCIFWAGGCLASSTTTRCGEEMYEDPGRVIVWCRPQLPAVGTKCMHFLDG